MKRSRRALALLATLGLLLSLSGAAAGGAAAVKPIRDASPRADSPNYNNGQKLPIVKGEKLNGNAPIGPAKVGQTRTWLGLDDFRGAIALKNYTLRGVGTHVEVWVANNLNFPNPTMLNPLTSDPTDFFSYNDCRNDGIRNVITNSQVNYLISEFDGNIYPIESDWWSTPPNRNGKNAVLPKLIPNLPSSEYKGEGDNVVVLVDNVRDDNFYDQNNANTKSYIAGFYYSLFDEYFDRTVMSIDSWDWLHRTGADPAHAPSTNACTSAPARPYLYEGVFAHEYQHLLHHYTDGDEATWVNEGLSDFSEVITGYADLSKHVDEKGYESHTQCYLGWLSVPQANWNPIPRPCGPENGLTAWEDQGGDEILADYGFAMYFTNYLHSQGLDKDFFTAWQHNAGNGIDGLEAALAGAGGSTFRSLLEDELISALVDGYLDHGASGGASRYQNAATEATIYFSPEANSTVGAPPWGADYIDLGAGADLSSLVFNGDDEFVFGAGTDFVVDGDGYFTNPDVADGKYDNDLDISMARTVAGHDGKALSFDTYYDIELGWDFGFVQVSTNDGDTWQSLACSGTTSSHNADADPNIVAKVPGYTGPSDVEGTTTSVGTAVAPVHVTCPALPAGTDFLSFRFMTDSAVQFDGWHFKNLALDGVPFGDGTTTGWDNQAFFHPLDLTFGFALVGINGTVDAYGDVTAGDSIQIIKPALGTGQDFTADGIDFGALAGFDRVIAIVWGVPDSEFSTLYQPYSLMVDGLERADGA